MNPSTNATKLSTSSSSTTPNTTASAQVADTASSSNINLLQHQHQQQQQQIAALQQLMATQTMFNALTPEQRMVAQQLAADSIQFSLLKDFPPNIQVNTIQIYTENCNGLDFFMLFLAGPEFYLIPCFSKKYSKK